MAPQRREVLTELVMAIAFLVAAGAFWVAAGTPSPGVSGHLAELLYAVIARVEFAVGEGIRAPGRAGGGADARAAAAVRRPAAGARARASSRVLPEIVRGRMKPMRVPAADRRHVVRARCCADGRARSALRSMAGAEALIVAVGAGRAVAGPTSPSVLAADVGRRSASTRATTCARTPGRTSWTSCSRRSDCSRRGRRTSTRPRPRRCCSSPACSRCSRTSGAAGWRTRSRSSR